MVPGTAARALAAAVLVAGAVRVRSAPPPEQDVLVPGGIAAVARVLRIEPVPEPSRFIGEVTRLLYDVPLVKSASSEQLIRRLSAHLAAAPRDAAAADRVPMPLSAATWSQILRQPVTTETVFGVIATNREATLLCHGLAGLDDETLQFLSEHHSILRLVYDRHAATFAAFGGTLQIHGGRVRPRGGAEAVVSWEAALGVRVDHPEAFVRELYSRAEGRIAYLYDTLAQVEAPKLAFALGTWLPASARLARFKALVAAASASYREWRIAALPFSRPLYDLPTILERIQVDASGTPVLGSRALWTQVFETSTPRGDEPNAGAAPAPAERVDAAWLMESIVHRDAQPRADRADQFAFGQRVFGSAPDAALGDVAVALRSMPRYRMLMLTLERIGIASPAIYAAAIRQAQRLTVLPPQRAFPALAQFQGALALVARMTRVRTIEPSSVDALVAGLVSAPLDDEGRYAGGMVRWVADALRGALGRGDTLEATLLAGMAGRAFTTIVQDGEEAASASRVRWEGHQYRLDLAGAELRRLRRVRDKQDGATVDVAADVDAVARALMREHLTLDEVRSAAASLKAVAARVQPRRRRIDAEAMPPGVETPRNPRDVLDRAVKDLESIEHAREPARAGRVAALLLDAADALMADALLSLTYAAEVGDPDGPVLLAGNVARRHDFGFSLKDSEMRARGPWIVPRQEVAPGAPWHVSGSLLGLDVGLAPLALRRLSTDRVIDAPVLTSNERETFAVSTALLNARALRDEDRDAIAAAVARGRRRVASLTPASVDETADAIGMDGWRRRALRWTLAHDPARAASFFTLTETLFLGAPTTNLDAWGMSALVSTGCVCTRLGAPARWTLWTGRPQLGQMASSVADLNLHVALTLHELGLPAALARHVLEAAMQDFIDEVRPTDPNDWLTLARSAQQLSRERLEDYVASAAAADGPLAPDGSGALRQRR